MLSAPDLWLGVVIACLVWYSTITIYVAVRGAFDIKHMLARLRDSKTDEPDD
jgi:hypothetical protein